MDALAILARPLTVWEANDLDGLWLEASRDTKKTKSKPCAAPGGPSDRNITKSLLEQMKGLIAEGCPREALKLLLLSGVHSATDASIMQKLQDLHPRVFLSKHRVFLTPGSTDSQL